MNPYQFAFIELALILSGVVSLVACDFIRNLNLAYALIWTGVICFAASILFPLALVLN